MRTPMPSELRMAANSCVVTRPHAWAVPVVSALLALGCVACSDPRDPDPDERAWEACSRAVAAVLDDAESTSKGVEASRLVSHRTDGGWRVEGTTSAVFRHPNVAFTCTVEGRGPGRAVPHVTKVNVTR